MSNISKSKREFYERKIKVFSELYLEALNCDDDELLKIFDDGIELIVTKSLGHCLLSVLDSLDK